MLAAGRMGLTRGAGPVSLRPKTLPALHMQGRLQEGGGQNAIVVRASRPNTPSR